MNEIIYLINSLLDPIINNENYFLIFISIINIISWTCYYYITHNDFSSPAADGDNSNNDSLHDGEKS